MRARSVVEEGDGARQRPQPADDVRDGRSASARGARAGRAGPASARRSRARRGSCAAAPRCRSARRRRSRSPAAARPRRRGRPDRGVRPVRSWCSGDPAPAGRPPRLRPAGCSATISSISSSQRGRRQVVAHVRVHHEPGAGDRPGGGDAARSACTRRSSRPWTTSVGAATRRRSHVRSGLAVDRPSSGGPTPPRRRCGPSASSIATRLRRGRSAGRRSAGTASRRSRSGGAGSRVISRGSCAQQRAVDGPCRRSPVFDMIDARLATVRGGGWPGSGDHAAHRDADDVGPLDPDASSRPAVSSAMSASRYADLAYRLAATAATTWRRVGTGARSCRQADVAVVEADDPEPTVGQPLDERQRPLRRAARRAPSRAAAAALPDSPCTSYSMVRPFAAAAVMRARYRPGPAPPAAPRRRRPGPSRAIAPAELDDPGELLVAEASRHSSAAASSRSASAP